MTEHVHEWVFTQLGCYFMCVNGDCDERLYPKQAESRLNEYETLKAATERLSAKDAREMVRCVRKDCPPSCECADNLLAYADILEGEW